MAYKSVYMLVFLWFGKTFMPFPRKLQFNDLKKIHNIMQCNQVKFNTLLNYLYLVYRCVCTFLVILLKIKIKCIFLN